MCKKPKWVLLTDKLTRGPLALASGVSDEGKALIWAKDKLGRPCLGRVVEGEQPNWEWANCGWPDTPGNRSYLQEVLDIHNLDPEAEEVVFAPSSVTKEAGAATPSVTKEEALALIQCLISDFEALKSGDWVPDDDSCDVSIEVAECIQAFLEEVPCAS